MEMERKVEAYRREIEQITGLDEIAELGEDDVTAIEMAALLVAARARAHSEGWHDDRVRVAAIAAAGAQAILAAMIRIIMQDHLGGKSHGRASGD